ncbi:hypothetical protein L1887_17068 [Cichorium endivia]|nr:hypothetical protein L1887_17068 [Cichorium endivia]
MFVYVSSPRNCNYSLPFFIVCKIYVNGYFARLKTVTRGIYKVFFFFPLPTAAPPSLVSPHQLFSNDIDFTIFGDWVSIQPNNSMIDADTCSPPSIYSHNLIILEIPEAKTIHRL